MSLRARLKSLALLAIALAASESPGLRGSSGGVEQVLVFDAGSSGTRIHVFNFSPLAPGVGVPRVDLSVRDAQTKKVKPGLSHYARSQTFEEAGKSVRELLDFADQFVPAERRRLTPVLLKATAGLRAVGDELASATLKAVRSAIGKSGYRFLDEWADIIKGKEEAGLAWVAANYLRGTFDGSAEGTLGIIEMGGGSTQVSFEIRPDETVAPDDSFIFTTALRREYRLYAHSYIGFGQDYAQSNAKERLPSTDVEDPCYPKGYQRQRGESFIQGSGHQQSCEAGLKERLFGDQNSPGHYPQELPLRGKFAATENFFYVRNDEHLALDARYGSMDDQAAEVCARPLPKEAKDSACFGLSYQVVLLQQLGVPTQPDVEVQVMRKINGGDVDWALGAALVHALASFPYPGAAGGAPSEGWSSFRLFAFVGLLAMFPLVRAVLGPVFCKGSQTGKMGGVAATVFGRGSSASL